MLRPHPFRQVLLQMPGNNELLVFWVTIILRTSYSKEGKISGMAWSAYLNSSQWMHAVNHDFTILSQTRNYGAPLGLFQDYFDLVMLKTFFHSPLLMLMVDGTIRLHLSFSKIARPSRPKA